jgi:hypothetical protein
LNAEEEKGTYSYEELKRALSIFFSVLLLSVGFGLGYVSGPKATGLAILISIIVYVLVFALGPEVRIPFLSLALGSHVGFLYAHRADTEVLPLFVITRDQLGESLAFDFIQLIVYLEIVAGIIRLRRKSSEARDLEKHREQD